MDALVLGGSRFVGLRLVKLLLEEGYRVTTLNRGVTPTPYDADRILVDRRHPGEVREALKATGFDVAFDISAYRRSESEPVVKALEGQVDRFVHCSTLAVYGRGGEMPYKEDSPRDPARAGSEYARNKIGCEDLLLEAHRDVGFPVVILRPPFIYGPFNYLYREGYFFDRIEAERPVPMPKGEEEVQFVHVDDLARAFLAAATRREVEGEAYNVAGEPVTFRRFADHAGRAIGVDPRVTLLDDRHLESLFPFPNATFTCDATKAGRDLGIQPRGIKEGLQSTYEWYRDVRPFGDPDFTADDGALRSRA